MADLARCRLKTDAKRLLEDMTPDYDRCEDVYDTRFPSIEQKAGSGR